MNQTQTDVIIVGGGLAGLTCALFLQRAGLSYQLLEAADDFGGRVRTDRVDGFLLDRGFQVLLPAYPELKSVLDLDALNLRPFFSGARVHTRRGVREVADPRQHWREALKGLRSDLWQPLDLWKLLQLWLEFRRRQTVYTHAEEMRTEDFLRLHGFSKRVIEEFFRPFFGGVFLERDLRTSSSVFAFLFMMFEQQGAAVPEFGMGEIPKQLVGMLKRECLHTQTEVARVEPGRVELADGRVLHAREVVLAVSEQAMMRIANENAHVRTKPRARPVNALYFAANKIQETRPILYLDGTGKGPVNNVCVMSNVSARYAPPGQHLIAAAVLGAAGDSSDLEAEVRLQLSEWFGREVMDWTLLRRYRIAEAQPEERQLRVGSGPVPARIEPGLVRAGDYCSAASINGAMHSGRLAAREVLQGWAK